MTDYDALVKNLRFNARQVQRFGSTVWKVGTEILLFDAADAIEELLQKEKFHAFLWNVINPNDMQLYLEMYHSGDEKEDAG